MGHREKGGGGSNLSVYHICTRPVPGDVPCSRPVLVAVHSPSHISDVITITHHPPPPALNTHPTPNSSSFPAYSITSSPFSTSFFSFPRHATTTQAPLNIESKGPGQAPDQSPITVAAPRPCLPRLITFPHFFFSSSGCNSRFHI
jgi:hypothetical protein